MVKKEKKQIHKHGTLAWLESIYFNDGPEAARAAFQQYHQVSSSPSYEVIRRNEGRRAVRTDVKEGEGINYLDFSPPASWEEPFTILLADFDPTPKEDFMYHAGQEYLIPIEGSVVYNYFFHGVKGNVGRTTVKLGQVIEIDPAIPHHTWGARQGGLAWMVIRHWRDTAAAITHTPIMSEARLHAHPRRVTMDKLKEPGIYALIAWGLAERLRFYRERSGCRISDLAAACGIDSAHISRVENGESNISLQTLDSIATYLNMNIEDFIAPDLYEPVVKNLPVIGSKSDVRPLMLIPSSHTLDVSCWSLPQSESRTLSRATGVATPVSWIVLQGQVIFECKDDAHTFSRLVEAGDVVHFKLGVAQKVQALTSSQIIGVVSSTAPITDK